MPCAERVLAGATAALGYLALGVAGVVTRDIAVADGLSVGQTLVQFFSYFTILSNIFAAAVLTRAALKCDAITFLARPTIMSAAAVYMGSAGLIYVLALRGFLHPRGWFQIFVDILLHGFLPTLIILWWLMFVPKGTLRVTDAIVWLLFPFGYWIYIFVRGAVFGAYPYPLVDPALRGWTRALTNSALHIGTILVLGLAAVAVNQWMAQRNGANKNRAG